MEVKHMKLNKIFTGIIIAFSLPLAAQEVQSDSLAGNPVLMRYYELHPSQVQSRGQAAGRMATVLADTLSLPFHDDFSRNSFITDTSLWADTESYVFVNRTYPVAPVNIGVATFDGCNEYGYPYNALAAGNSTGRADVLSSKPLDMQGTPADSAYLSFYYQPRGLGNPPESIDSLILEYTIPAWSGAWRQIWFKGGYSPSASDTGFHRVMLYLDSASYYVKGFRFRFRNTATLSGNVDHWNLDEVYLAKNRTINDTVIGDVAFVYEMPSMLQLFRAVPAWHYTPVMCIDSLRSVFIRNNDDAVRNITYKYRVLSSSGGILYEYPSAAGGVDNLSPFETSGYESLPSLYHPAVSTFPGFSAFPPMPSPADTTYFEVQHILKESASVFDTVSFMQNFYNYYAYDDGTAEASYGVNVTNGMIAYKFTTPVSDTLTAVQMYFNPVPNTNSNVPQISQTTFRLCVWTNNNGQPGNLVYSQNTQSPQYLMTPNRYINYTIDSGTVIVGGTFFIGWIQNSPYQLNLGVDRNTKVSGKQFYNISGTWNSSIYDDAWMMRPVFRSTYDATGVNEISHEQLSVNVYPNPAHDLLQVNVDGLSAGTTLSYALYDLSGRQVMRQQDGAFTTLDVSALNSGLYFLNIVDAKTGKATTKKFVKD